MAQECGLFQECNFLKKIRGKEKFLYEDIVKLYCQGPGLDTCERKNFYEKYGEQPLDNLLPNGKIYNPGQSNS